MRLVLLRHPVADAETAQLSDAGRREMRRVLYRLRRLQKAVDVVAGGEGPVPAATAAMVARTYGKSAVESVPALGSDGSADALLAWLQAHDRDAVIVLVGPEPDLGRLAGLLTSGRSKRVAALQACGVCRIDCEGPAAPAAGMLRWLLTPMQLRKLKV